MKTPSRSTTTTFRTLLTQRHGDAHVQATATNSNRSKGQGDSGRLGSAHRSS